MAAGRPYHIINFVLAGIISLVFLYSAFFTARADRHPVPSFYEETTGQKAPSAGMSRAFSEIIRGKIRSARAYNPDSPMVFLFFLVQLVQRIGASLLLYYGRLIKRHLLLADVSFSLLMFLICFWNQGKAALMLWSGG